MRKQKKKQELDAAVNREIALLTEGKRLAQARRSLDSDRIRRTSKTQKKFVVATARFDQLKDVLANLRSELEDLRMEHNRSSKCQKSLSSEMKRLKKMAYFCKATTRKALIEKKGIAAQIKQLLETSTQEKISFHSNNLRRELRVTAKKEMRIFMENQTTENRVTQTPSRLPLIELPIHHDEEDEEYQLARCDMHVLAVKEIWNAKVRIEELKTNLNNRMEEVKAAQAKAKVRLRLVLEEKGRMKRRAAEKGSHVERITSTVDAIVALGLDTSSQPTSTAASPASSFIHHRTVCLLEQLVIKVNELLRVKSILMMKKQMLNTHSRLSRRIDLDDDEDSFSDDDDATLPALCDPRTPPFPRVVEPECLPSAHSYDFEGSHRLEESDEEVVDHEIEEEFRLLSLRVLHKKARMAMDFK
ncbi:unnamed protein product [Lampetra fluviatilis]